MSTTILSRLSILTVLLLLFVNLPAQQQGLPTCEISIVDSESNVKGSLTVELARSAQEKTYGLMHRKSLGENKGMLFIHPHQQYLSYWMKNVSIPLSIAYIDQNGTIMDIQKMDVDGGKNSYLSRFPARYALEVNQGWFEKNKITTGYKVQFNGCLSL